jgi:aspartate aminotransferase-like enzyme
MQTESEGSTKADKPALRPANPRFSSGPCTKHPGWSLDRLKGALLGRSHRQPDTRARLELALTRTAELLDLPPGYRVAIVPASDTGAVEMALWSLLGARGVDVLAWEAFSRDWVTDIVEQLKLKDVRALLAPYGELPDLAQVDCDRDVVFAWNGTTSGVRVPNAEWIASDRKGLTICDATSAVFAQQIDWSKLDAATFSWQKVLGGEAQHGMLILSPRAIERLESYTPAWPLPKLFRMTRHGKLSHELFEGSTINTPSMLCLQGLSRCARLGRKRGRRGRHHGALGRKCRRDRRLGGAHRVGGFSRASARDALQHLALSQDRGPRGGGPATRHARCVSGAHRGFARRRGRRQGYRLASVLAAGLAHLDRSHGGEERSRGAVAVARLGLRRNETDAGQGGLSAGPQSSP